MDVTSDFSPVKIAEEVLLAVGIVLAIIPLVMGGSAGGGTSKDPRHILPDTSPQP